MFRGPDLPLSGLSVLLILKQLPMLGKAILNHFKHLLTLFHANHFKDLRLNQRSYSLIKWPFNIHML